MPLLPGKKNIGRNIKELLSSQPSSARAKGIATLAKRRGVTKKKAKQIQAKAIAMNKSRKPSKGTMVRALTSRANPVS